MCRLKEKSWNGTSNRKKKWTRLNEVFPLCAYKHRLPTSLVKMPISCTQQKNREEEANRDIDMEEDADSDMEENKGVPIELVRSKI